MILKLYFLIVTVLTVTNGEHQNEFGCEKSKIFCEATRECVERTFVCNGFINCSDPANPNASNELNCFGVYSESHLKSQDCPENWIGPWKRSCYFFRPDTKKSWFDARQECRNLYSKAQLMSSSSSVSTKELASSVQRGWTDFIWIGEDERQKRFVTTITRGEYWSRRQVQCPALSLRNRPLFTQSVLEERSCNEKLNFICELRFPEVKNLKTGNWGSATPATPLQVFTEVKNVLTENMNSEEQGSVKNSQPIKINSHALVQGGANLLTHGDLYASMTAHPTSIIVSTTVSHKSLYNHQNSTFVFQKTVYWKDKFATENENDKNPVLKVTPSRKLEKPGRAVNMVSSVSVSPAETLPPLTAHKVLSQDDRMPRAREMFAFAAGDWGMRGARQGGNTVLSGHTSVVTGTILSSDTTATSIFQSTYATQTVATPLLTSRPSETVLVTTQLPIANLSVSATGQLTSSWTIKPTPSRAVNHSSFNPFTQPSTQDPNWPKLTTQAATGFALSAVSVIGVSAGGGALLLLILGVAILCYWLKYRRKRSDTEQAIRTSVLWDDSNWDVRFSATGITSLSDSGGRIDWAATGDGVELTTPSSTTTNKTFLY